MKLPGLAGPISSANGGFGGSQLSNRPNSDRAWSIRQLLHRPHSKYKSLAMGMEHYWQGSSHLSKGNYYGDPQWYKSDGQSINESLAAVPGKWVEVKVHVKVNDHNVANGFLRTYLDGKPGYTKENFEWSKAADMLTINHLWFCVYHGGLAKKSDGQIVLFFRQFEYQILG